MLGVRCLLLVACWITVVALVLGVIVVVVWHTGGWFVFKFYDVFATTC